MMHTDSPKTALCSFDETTVRYRDKDLVEDLLGGEMDFVHVMSEHILGRPVSKADLKVIHAVLIVLMEHGMSPGAISTRLVYMSAPENLQSAVAAGLLAVGSQFVGTVENTARLLEGLVAIDDADARRARTAELVRVYRARREPIPGLGHHLHKPDDPRAMRLLALADELGLNTSYVPALRALAEEVDAAAGRHIPINATGAIGALLGEIRVPIGLMRGFAVISRAAGLVAHVGEEQQQPSGRHIWDLVLNDMNPDTP